MFTACSSCGNHLSGKGIYYLPYKLTNKDISFFFTNFFRSCLLISIKNRGGSFNSANVCVYDFRPTYYTCNGYVKILLRSVHLTSQ